MNKIIFIHKELILKVVGIIGSARIKNTFNAVAEIERNLKQYGDIDFEYILLNEYDLKFCNGCKVCFDKGENYCPIKDDRDIILSKIESADGVILASPNYSFAVSARVKNLLDRIAFIFHRPRFFGKVFMPIVCQGVFGGNKITKYMKSCGANLGFTSIQGYCINTLEPLTEKRHDQIKKEMEKASKRFYNELYKKKYRQPTLLRQMLFCMTRSGIKHAETKLYDYEYYKKSGWFESEYYYDIRLGFMRKLLGRLFDSFGKQIAKNS